MGVVVIFALLTAFVIYLAVGVLAGRRASSIADLLPLGTSRQARVENSSEFSSSTIATTISLATVIMAFFELAGRLGLWLFWTVITTSAGLFVVRMFAKRIWDRMSIYDHRPTLHEFLGTEFNSRALCQVGAICTSLGFLGMFAVELTVGSKFLAVLVPGIPAWAVVIVLSVVAFTYTAIGGFRAVIITDRIQMYSIWLLLIWLPAFYVYYVVTHGGWSENLATLPAGTLSFSYREGLAFFLMGIFVINVPTFLSDMSIWQRIAGSQKDKTVTGGLWFSVFGSAVTWSLFALLACLAFMIAKPQDGVNPLLGVLSVISSGKGLFAGCVVFFTVLGLYGAMLSTASTQLIAVSHTLYEDIFSHLRKHPLSERLALKGELKISRTILVSAAIVSTIMVEVLSRAGFSIVDLVFAIYGAQLGLCPLVVCALLLDRWRLRNLARWAVCAVASGFITGWATAIYGRYTPDRSVVFLAPVLSLLTSSMILGVGFLVEKIKTGPSET